MAFPWYVTVLISLGVLLIIAIFTIILIRILRAKARTKQEQPYTPLATDESLEGNEKKTQLSKFKEQHSSTRSNVSLHSGLDSEEDTTKQHNVTVVKETFAEISTSDWDTTSDRDSFTNGDVESERDSLRVDTPDCTTASRLQVSLIYNAEKKYLAGKIIKLDAVPSMEQEGPDQIKIHVVLLPTRRYILKTRYHNVKELARLNEYFKMKFKILPPLELTAIRYRIYGRKVKFGIPAKEKCLGETSIGLLNVASSKGGITMWKSILPKRSSRSLQYRE